MVKNRFSPTRRAGWKEPTLYYMASPSSGASLARKLRILIVEDNAPTRLAMSRLMRDAGADVVTARDGAAIEAEVNFVEPLGPDASATALGKFLEVGAATLDGRRDGLVLHEQPFQCLTGGITGDGLLNGNPNVAARLNLKRHGSTPI